MGKGEAKGMRVQAASYSGRAVGVLLLLAVLGGRAFAQCEFKWRPLAGAPVGESETRAATAWDPDGDGPLPERLVIVGDSPSSGSKPAYQVAAWDGQRWELLGDSFDKQISCLAVYRGELIAAGSFTQCGSAAISHIARWDQTAWAPLG